MASRKPLFDWDRIEIEYLSGEYSVREIADRHEISEGAIRKRAKAEKWVKPVRSLRTVRTVRTSEPAAAREAQPPADAPEIAERGRQLVSRMLDELDTATSQLGELEALIEGETSDDRSASRREAMLKALSLGERANTLKTVAAAFKTLNEASAPQGKKAQQQQRADAIGAGARFAPLGPPKLAVVKPG